MSKNIFLFLYVILYIYIYIHIATIVYLAIFWNSALLMYVNGEKHLLAKTEDTFYTIRRSVWKWHIERKDRALLKSITDVCSSKTLVLPRPLIVTLHSTPTGRLPHTDTLLPQQHTYATTCHCHSNVPTWCCGPLRKPGSYSNNPLLPLYTNPILNLTAVRCGLHLGNRGWKQQTDSSRPLAHFIWRYSTHKILWANQIPAGRDLLEDRTNQTLSASLRVRLRL